MLKKLGQGRLFNEDKSSANTGAGVDFVAAIKEGAFLSVDSCGLGIYICIRLCGTEKTFTFVPMLLI